MCCSFMIISESESSKICWISIIWSTVEGPHSLKRERVEITIFAIKTKHSF